MLSHPEPPAGGAPAAGGSDAPSTGASPDAVPPPPPLPEPIAAPPDPAAVLDSLPRLVTQLKRETDAVVVGQGEVVDAIVFALLCRGHCLLTGVPGLGKTLLVNALARLLGLPFARIQFTPDLMPSDITGTEILEEDPETGRRRFTFVPGPLFTSVLLADEINRTPPKTQAALLEAMQEKTVTVAGASRRLD
ncbi:MAG TPA: AAA family ATPase, partial [Thermoanaerobaculia bacterium]